MSAYARLVTCLLGIAMAVYTLVLKFLHHDLVPGWPSVVILQCLLSGTILVSVGLLGEYVGRIYEEIKQRPLYVVGWTMNLPKKTSEQANKGVPVNITVPRNLGDESRELTN